MSYTNNETLREEYLELKQEAKYVFGDYTNERSILTIALKNEDAFYSLLARADEDDFLLDDTRALYRIIKLLHIHGVKGFDPQLIVKTAKELNLDSLLNLTFIDAIFNTQVCYDNFDLYIDKLLDDSTKYKLYNQLHANKELVYEHAKKTMSESSEELLSKVQSDLLSLSIRSSAISEPVHISEGLEDYIESIKDQHVEVIGLSTGYPLLDKAIDGLIPGTLMVIAARKKMGKSAFLTNIAANVAVLNDQPVLYIDTEMTFKEWRDRVLAIISGIEERVIKHGGFAKDPKIYDKIMRSIKILNKSKLYHYYLPGYTIDKISAVYEKYKLKEDIKLGIFDYIKEPDLSSVDGGRKEHQILGDVTTKLKDLSGTLNIPFLAAVQLNRSGDVADSDRVARYGDVIAFWGMRDLKTAEENNWDLDVCGHYGLCIKDSRRGGRTGEAGIGYKFLKSKIKILEVPIHEHIEDIYGTSLEHIDVSNLEELSSNES